MAVRKGAAPKLIAYIAASVDGYIAAPDGSCDWLEPYSDALVDMPKFYKSIGACVMGRGTYDFMLRNPLGASLFGSRAIYVLSHRELPPL